MRRVTEHIYAPIMGLDYRVPDTMKKPRYASDIHNCRIANGEIRKDWGYSVYGTNTPVLGTPCLIDVYKEYDGDLRPLLFTTKYIYEYETASDRWNVISKGTVIEDCEDDWAVNSPTTQATSTDEIRGTNSRKITIHADEGTGVCAYENFDAIDASGDSYLHFWVKADRATIATEFDIRISEEVAGGDGADYEDVSIPALVANTWTEVEVAFAEATTTRNALLSVSLVVASDEGAAVVYLDDIRALDRRAGDQDDGWNSCVHFNEYMACNVDDEIQRKSQAGDFADLAGAELYKCKDMQSFKTHMVLLNLTDDGTVVPQRVRWSIAGGLAYEAADWTGTGSGTVDIIETPGHIVKSKFMGDALIIYKEDSIYAMTWVGGTTYFRFDQMVVGLGLIGQRALTNYRGHHFFLGTDYNIYEYIGDRSPVPIGDAVAPNIAANINPANEDRCVMYMDEDDNELMIGIPTGVASQPDTFYRYNFKEKNWSKSDRPWCCVGKHQEYSTQTLGTYGGTIGQAIDTLGSTRSKTSAKVILVADSSGNVYKIDKTTVNLAGVAQDSWWDSIDHTMTGKKDKEDESTVEYRQRYKRVMKEVTEARGDLVDVYWSEDGGLTWEGFTGSGSHTLTDRWEIYDSDLDQAVERMRIRFRNSIVTSDMRVRYYALDYITGGEKEQ